MTHTIFIRSSGEAGKKARKELMDEKREINRRCMEIRLSYATTKEAVEAAYAEGLRGSDGKILNKSTLLYRCQWALVDDPDYWRDALDAFDRKSGDGPLTDIQWDQHVMEVAVDISVHSIGVVRQLIQSDPARWGVWAWMWAGNPRFDWYKAG